MPGSQEKHVASAAAFDKLFRADWRFAYAFNVLTKYTRIAILLTC